jgi:hypothetical protein
MERTGESETTGEHGRVITDAVAMSGDGVSAAFVRGLSEGHINFKRLLEGGVDAWLACTRCITCDSSLSPLALAFKMIISSRLFRVLLQQRQICFDFRFRWRKQNVVIPTKTDLRD